MWSYFKLRSLRRLLAIFLLALILLLLPLWMRKTGMLYNKSMKADFGGYEASGDGKGKIVFAINTPPEISVKRYVIRDTWISHLRKLGYGANKVDAFFFMSIPDSERKTVIDREQKMHKDIFTIKSMKKETYEMATFLKTTEMFTQYLNEECNESKNCHLRWMCKVDDDSFLVVKPLMERYLLNNSVVPKNTLIGRALKYKASDGGEFMYPGGQFWCASHDLLPILAEGPKQIYPDYGLDNQSFIPDDLITGDIFYRLKRPVTLIDMPNKFAHDVNDEDFMKEDDGRNNFRKDDDSAFFVHPPTPDSINVHRLKKDQEFLKLAMLYDENGWLNQ